MMNCPSFENLIAYLEGDSDKAARQAVHAHLDSGCSKCEAERGWYEQVKAITAGDDLVEPPPWVLRRAIKLFETQSQRESFGARASRIIADLVFDSLATTSFAGARSTTAAERQLLYRADRYSIDLQLADAGEMHSHLTGQILRDGEIKFESVAGVQLNLTRDGQTMLSTTTNRFGEFSIASIESGNYDLHIRTNEISITVVGLPIA
jgi:hypothetical protein